MSRLKRKKHKHIEIHKQNASVNTLSMRYLFAFFHIILGTFLVASIVSYSPLDNCLNVSSVTNTMNWCGHYGAIVSDLLLQFFGFGAWMVVVSTFVLAFRLLLSMEKINFFIHPILTMMAMIAVSLSAGFFHSYDFAMQMMPGGYVGYHLSSLLSIKIGNVVGFMISIFICVAFCFIALGIKADNVFNLSKWLLKRKGEQNNKPVGFSKIIHKFVILTVLKNFIRKINTSLKAVGRVFGRNKKHNTFDKKLQKRQPIKPKVKETNETILKQNITDVLVEKDQKNSNISVAKNEILGNEDPYIPPSPELLENVPNDIISYTDEEIASRKEQLLSVLKDFGVSGELVSSHAGPVVTLHELKPEAGTKASRVIGLASDIARTMRVPVIRIADVPHRGVIGIEVPNVEQQKVVLRGIIDSPEYKSSRALIPIAFGKDIMGVPIIEDMTKMPHLLIAGTTGSGKSVGLNAMILSILYTMSPDLCKFLMIDPKMLELSLYDGIPHLLSPVVTEPEKAILALRWVVAEMTQRYKIMSSLAVRNIQGYNQKALMAQMRDMQIVRDIEVGYDKETGKVLTEQIVHEAKIMPYIIVVIDEMADLMLIAGKEMENLVQRLAQMARAAGIHMIMATQRPSVDVITGVIKANFPTRISYQVASKIDSRTILGEMGAEQLLGNGDMLYLGLGKKAKRIHGPYVSESEIKAVVDYLSQKYPYESHRDIFKEALEKGLDVQNGADNNEKKSINDAKDKLYSNAVKVVIKEKKTSISYLQRSLGIGYNKAAGFIERMESEGILSSPDNVGRRIILVTKSDEDLE